MKRALALAAQAPKLGEIPVGAALYVDGHLVSRSYNLTRTKSDPTGHAEMVVIRRAIKKFKNERFLNSILYVTLEPCAMCAGAIIQARIPTVVFGAYDEKAGACGSALQVLPHPKLNHKPHVIGGVLAEECAQVLKDFFKVRRAEIKAKKRRSIESGNSR